MATTAQRIQRHGIVIPGIAIAEAERAHLPLEDLCAFLMKETSGGHNVFGHDPTIYAGAGIVTKAKYLAYKQLRRRTGKMQGAGPLQLTWYSFQDAADKMGGCWLPKYNVREGAHLIAGYVRSEGLWKGAHDYNGTGPAAVAYANSIVSMAHTWRLIIAGRLSLLGGAAASADEEIQAAHLQHAVLLATPKVPQSYLPKAYCWNHRNLQIATSKRDEVDAFMAKHPSLRIYAAFATSGHVEHSDHYCGYATDLVPITTGTSGKAALQKAQQDAKAKGVPYTELVWTSTNKHLHVSWARCPA